ncbi:MAG: exo-alpha-sialidase [Nitrococcus mobilis]|nr:exo-alpha-sialidase [Nitrococcus mobilis]
MGLAGALAVVEVAPAAQAAAAALELSEPVTLTRADARNPTMAVDRRSGTVYLAWAQETPGTDAAAKGGEQGDDPEVQALLARSEDGGRRFGAPVVVNTPQEHVVSHTVSPTRVAVGRKGEVYVLYQHRDVDYKPGGWPYGRNVFRLAVSHDGGRRFAAPVDVASEALEGVPTSVGMLNLFVAPQGTLYVSFLDFRERLGYFLEHQEAPPWDRTPPTQLRVARSRDGGKSFEASRLVSKPTCVCCGTQMAQGVDGPLYVTTRGAWKELKGSVDEVRDLFISTSRDEGMSWSKAAKIHDDRFKISGCPDVSSGLAVDAHGRLHAAWYTGTESHPGVFYARSDDEGQTFSKPITLLNDDWVPYGDVKLALDGEDNAWVAFEDRRGEEDRIQIARISPHGEVTFSASWPGTAPDITALDETALVSWSTQASESHMAKHMAGGAIKARLVRLGQGAEQ